MLGRIFIILLKYRKIVSGASWQVKRVSLQDEVTIREPVYYPKKVYSKVTIIERGKIILKGVEGTFRGKTLKTGLKAEDYF